MQMSFQIIELKYFLLIRGKSSYLNIIDSADIPFWYYTQYIAWKNCKSLNISGRDMNCRLFLSILVSSFIICINSKYLLVEIPSNQNFDNAPSALPEPQARLASKGMKISWWHSYQGFLI